MSVERQSGPVDDLCRDARTGGDVRMTTGMVREGHLVPRSSVAVRETDHDREGCDGVELCGIDSHGDVGIDGQVSDVVRIGDRGKTPQGLHAAGAE